MVESKQSSLRRGQSVDSLEKNSEHYTRTSARKSK